MPTNDFARDVLSLNTYTEVSPSGTGVKAIVRGTIRENHNLRAKDGLPKREVYDGRRELRKILHDNSASAMVALPRFGQTYRSSSTGFMTSISELTKKAPKVLRRAQTSPPQEDYNDAAVGLSDLTILDLLREARNGKNFERLFLGVWDDYDSQSEADAALVAMFRFYSRDVPQIDRLFRQSGLHRPKWGERRGAMTYGETTIRNILAKGGRRYGFDRPRNPRMQVLPAWYSKTLKGCGALGTRLAYGVFPWYADDEGFCGRLTGAQLAREKQASTREEFRGCSAASGTSGDYLHRRIRWEGSRVSPCTRGCTLHNPL